MCIVNWCAYVNQFTISDNTISIQCACQISAYRYIPPTHTMHRMTCTISCFPGRSFRSPFVWSNYFDCSIGGIWILGNAWNQSDRFTVFGHYIILNNNNSFVHSDTRINLSRKPELSPTKCQNNQLGVLRRSDAIPFFCATFHFLVVNYRARMYRHWNWMRATLSWRRASIQADGELIKRRMWPIQACQYIRPTTGASMRKRLCTVHSN